MTAQTPIWPYTGDPFQVVPFDDGYDPRNTADRIKVRRAASWKRPAPTPFGAASHLRPPFQGMTHRQQVARLICQIGLAMFGVLMFAFASIAASADNFPPGRYFVVPQSEGRVPAPRPYANDYGSCLFIGLDNSEGGTYSWVLAKGDGPERVISAEPIELEPGEQVTCAALEIDWNELVASRWFWIRRLESVPVESIRGNYNGLACASDFNGDGFVNIQDFAVLRRSFFTNSCDVGFCAADLNGDGVVNIRDLALFRLPFGSECFRTARAREARNL